MEEVPRVPDPSLIWIASDTHYVSPEMTDYGPAFRTRLDEDDGKDLYDIDRILDCWISEALEALPGTVLLTGDLVMDGETENHLELREKLEPLRRAGVQVLVLPGNHDINVDYWSSSYRGEARTPAPTPANAAEFLEIWHAFGYDEADARDPASLSYLSKVSDRFWLLMLDSAIYAPRTLVGGRIREETLLWMENILKEAEDAGAVVIPAAHHNLLSESRLYRTDCTIENSREVTALLERYGVPLWFSGHLHLQRIRTHIPAPGESGDGRIREVVHGAFSMAPFPYGVLTLKEDGGMEYRKQEVTLPEDLTQKGINEFLRVLRLQGESRFRGIPEELSEEIGSAYALLMLDYVTGVPLHPGEIRSSRAWALAEKFSTPEDTVFSDRVRAILAEGASFSERPEALSVPGRFQTAEPEITGNETNQRGESER